jgi:hypothetical protein
LPFGSISVIPTRAAGPFHPSNASSLSVPLGIVNWNASDGRAEPNWSTNVLLLAVRLTDPVSLLTVLAIWRAWACTICLVAPRLVTLTDLVAVVPAVWLISS